MGSVAVQLMLNPPWPPPPIASTGRSSLVLARTQAGQVGTHVRAGASQQRHEVVSLVPALRKALGQQRQRTLALGPYIASRSCRSRDIRQ